VPGTYKRSFWDGFGPMPAAATLFLNLPEFAQSTMVTRIGLDQTATVQALSEASFGQTVLAVTEIDGVDWMAELRVATNWDRGLDGHNGPGSAVVLHTVPRIPPEGRPRQSMYWGRIPLDDPRETFIQPPGSDLKLVLEVFDATRHTAQIRFTRDAPPVAVGIPAPQFLPEPIDRECAPASGQYSVALPQVYDLARNGHGERAKFYIIVTGNGRSRLALSQRPTADPGTGGIAMIAHECEQGRRVAQWTVLIIEVLGSYLVRIDGPGLDGEMGTVSDSNGWKHTNPDGSGIEIRSWRVPDIY